MPKIRDLLLINLLFISGIVSAEKFFLQVEGLSGSLRKNVLAQISTIKQDEITLDEPSILRVKNVIRDGLKALGYYKPDINFYFFSSQKEKHQIIIFRVNPGRPIRICKTCVVLRGDARTDPDYLNLLRKRPTIGTVLNHIDYDNFKKSLINLALHKGYFDSHFNKSHLSIVLNKYQSFWDIDYDSGKRYHFGTVTFEGAKVRDEYLKNIIPFKKGDYYESRKLAELDHRLSITGWFNSFLISPEFSKSYNSKILSFHGKILPKFENIIEIGVGYSTDVGPRVKILWKKPLMNSYGHNLDTNVSISNIEQQINFNYKIPLLKNPIEHYYLTQGKFKHSYLNNIETDSAMIAISRYWNFPDGWQLAVNLHWNFNYFIQSNGVDTVTTLFYPGMTVTRTRSLGDLIPIWGDFQRYSINYSNNTWNSNINFFIVQAKNVWIRTLNNRHRFVIRGNFGQIKTNNFNSIPPDLHFFMIGDRSIRGYKYKSIIPTNENGELVNSSEMIIGSIEYQYNNAKRWWWATFIDSGRISTNNVHYNEFKTGIGVGIRWKSPFGPIKLDFAIPISNKEKHNLQFYVGFGPEL